MPLPTLLRKGSIVPSSKTSKTEKNRIANTRGIDYIMDFISDRTPVSYGGAPKKPVKTFGERVLVLKSATGSGKSTVTLPFLY